MTETTLDRVTDAAGRACLALLLAGVVLIIEPYTASPSDGKLLFFRVMVAALAALAITKTTSGFASPTRSPFFYLFAILIGLSLLSWAAHSFGLRGILEVFQLASLGLVWWAAFVFIRGPKQFDGVAAVYCLAVGAASIYGLSQRLGWDPFPWDPRYLDTPEYRHLPSTFGNPNVAGHALVPALILSGYLALARRWRWAWVPFTLTATHLAFTGHRSGWAAFAAGGLVIACALWAARRRRSFHARMFAAVALSLVTIAACAALAAGTVWVKGGGALEQSFALRLNSFYGASKMIADHPVFGVGPGHYAIANVRYWTPLELEHYARDGQFNDHPHNETLNAAVELGVGGGAAYLLLQVLAVVLALGWAFAGPRGPSRSLAITLAGMFTAFFADGMLGFNWRSIPSAAIYVVALGAMAGMSAPPSRRRRSASNWALVPALGLFLLAMLYVEVNVFTSKAYLQRALGAAQQGYLDEAAEAAERATRWGGWGWQADFERGRIARERGNFDEAIKAFPAALERHPNYVPAWLEWGRAALVRSSKGSDPSGDLDQAENAATRALLLCPRLAQGEELLARVALARAARDAEGAPALRERAREHLKLALEFGVRNASELYRLIGETHRLDDHYAAAFAAYELSAEADPGNAALWRAFDAAVRDTAGADRMRAALLRAETALGASNDRPEALATVRSLLGRLMARNYDDPDRALEYFRGAAEAWPDSMEVWGRFAEFALEAGRLDDLRSVFLDVFAKDLSDRAKGPAALAGLRETWADSPDAARGSFTVANAVRELSAANDPRLEDLAWAVDVLAAEAVKSGGAVDRRVVTNLAGAYSAMKKPELAEALLRRVEWGPRDENYAIAIVLLAEALEALDRAAEAIDVLDEAATLRSDSLELRLAAARLKARAGKAAAARFEYEGILAAFQLDAAARARIEQEMGALR